MNCQPHWNNKEPTEADKAECLAKADMTECNVKEGTEEKCIWTVDPASQCQAPAGTEPQPCGDNGSKQYWDTYTCEYKCPPSGYCKWDQESKDPSTQPTGTNPCYAIAGKEEQGCNAIPTCSWYDFEKNRPKQLFSAPFCHPIKIDGPQTAAMWTPCLGKSDDATCPSATCTFSTMVELIPKNEDFCAPQYTNANVEDILECTNHKTAATC